MGFLDTLADILTREPKKKAEYGVMSDALAAQNAGYGVTGGLLNAVDPYILDPMNAPEHKWIRQNLAAKSAKDMVAPSADAMERIGMAGIFAGPKAKTANLVALKKAEELAAKGVDNEAVRQATGWFKGMGDKWMYEIDDSAARMTDAVDLLRKKPGMTQGKILDHENLYSAYPELSDMWTMRAGREETGGSYIHSAKAPAIELGIPTARRPIDREALRETNLHELQHAIQQREGFPNGGSPENASMYTPEFDAWSKLRGSRSPEESAAYRAIPSDWDAYQRLAGEIEARDVSARMNLTPEQRLATPPDLRPDAIIRYGNGPQMSVPGYVDDAAVREANLAKFLDGNKIVDASGKDLTVYHGTGSDYDVIKPSRIGELGPGVYLTTATSEAGSYANARPGSRVIPFHVNMKNPLEITSPAQFWDRFGGGTDEDAIRKLIDAGYDGISLERPVQVWSDAANGVVDTGEMQRHLLSVDPQRQLKSIFNRGTYDPSEPSFLKSLIPAAATAYGIEEVLPYD